MFTPADYKLDIEQIVIPPGFSPIQEVFFIQNLTTIMPNEKESTEEFINNLQKGTSVIFMLIFTDGSAESNPGPTESAAVIKNRASKVFPIKE